jgi:hypothetical protein
MSKIVGSGRLRVRLGVAVAASAAALAAIATAGIAWGGSADTPPGTPGRLDSVSTRGVPPAGAPVLEGDRRAFARMARPGVRELGATMLMAAHRGRGFYRIANAASSDCYAVGPAAAAANFRFGEMACVPNFPSATLPILDFSFGHARRVEGFAADGVTRITLEDGAGRVVETASVVSNVYSLPVARRDDVARIVALDARGNEIYAQPVYAQADAAKG